MGENLFKALEQIKECCNSQYCDICLIRVVCTDYFNTIPADWEV